MKKIATFVCAAFATLIMASCSSNSPEGVVEKSMQCLIDKDYEGFIDNVLLNEKAVAPEKMEETKKECTELLETKFPKMIEAKGELKSVKVLSTEMSEDGDKAIVEIEETYEKNGETSKNTDKLQVKKDKDGNWKINFGNQ